MKLVFFKNESHFHPRLSYTWENAEQIYFNPKLQNVKKIFALLLAIPFIAFLFVNQKELSSKWLLLLAMSLLCLPTHELCHALFCWISGRNVERICFFPYKQIFSKAAGYVKPTFGVWNKYQAILLVSFPIIILSIIPAILAIFIAPLRLWVLYLSLLNISVSCSDIIDIICLFKLPPNALYLVDIILTVKETDKPVIIHQLFVTSKLDKIHHKCFEYFNGRLTEKEQPAETVETMKLKQEFIKQFDLK
jgi:hypothetical protein